LRSQVDSLAKERTMLANEVKVR